MLNLLDLDERTRKFMIAEVDFDIQRGKIYPSPRLSKRGTTDFSDLLRQAVEQFSDSWLANELRQHGRLNSMEGYTRNGRNHTRKMSAIAHEMLAEGEFNRFFTRGLCLRAVDENTSELFVYRAKSVSSPRFESEQLIGNRLAPQSLLRDLRKNVGTDTEHGMPGGPNSGLSVCLPASYKTISGS